MAPDPWRKNSFMPAPPSTALRGPCNGIAGAAGGEFGVGVVGSPAPDKHVGSVFIPLSPGFTRLPVNILVGDDAPVVIAAPQAPTTDGIAAVRHWVVRHQVALTSHWPEKIGPGRTDGAAAR